MGNGNKGEKMKGSKRAEEPIILSGPAFRAHLENRQQQARQAQPIIQQTYTPESLLGVERAPARPVSSVNPNVLKAYQKQFEKNRPKNGKEKAKKVMGGIAVGVAAFGVLGAIGAGTAWAFNFNDMREPSDATTSVTQGVDEAPIEELGKSSFELNQCSQPSAVAGVMTFNGELPLTPMVADDKDATLRPSEPIFLEENIGKIPSEEVEAAYEGEPVATFEGLKLALSICATTPADAITDGEGKYKYVVNMSSFTVKFRDSNKLFSESGRSYISATYKPSGVANEELNPEEGLIFKYPNPVHYLAPVKDNTAYNKILNATTAAMSTEPQMLGILSQAEIKAFETLIDTTDGQEGINYATGDKNISDFISSAIAKRLGVSKDQIQFKGIDYNYKMDSRIDPASKLPYSDALVGISRTEEVQNFTIDLDFKLLKEPDIPDPEPTETYEQEVTEEPQE